MTLFSSGRSSPKTEPRARPEEAGSLDNLNDADWQKHDAVKTAEEFLAKTEKERLEAALRSEAEWQAKHPWLHRIKGVWAGFWGNVAEGLNSIAYGIWIGLVEFLLPFLAAPTTWRRLKEWNYRLFSTTDDIEGFVASLYAVANPGMIGLAYTKSWPSARAIRDAVVITYRAGYCTPFTATSGAGTGSGTGSGTPIDDYITLSGRNPVDDERMRAWNTGGALPAGLSVNTDYFALNSYLTNCNLALTVGGSQVAMTSNGTGTHFVGVLPEELRSAMLLMIADLYENRSAQVERRLEANLTAHRLMWPYRVLESK